MHPYAVQLGRRDGQATIELVALALAIAALMAALTLGSGGLPGAIAGAVARVFGAVAGHDAPAAPASLAEAPPAVQRFVLAAVRGADDGTAPTLLDARRRLAAVLGAERADAELQALVWANVLAQHPDATPGGVFRAASPNPLGRFEDSRLSGVGALPAEDRTMFWSTERLRSDRVHLHVTTADEERAIAKELEPGWEETVDAVVSAAGESLLSALHPAFAVTFAAVRVAQAGLAHDAGTGVPPGARENDATLCIEVERTNHVGADGARFDATVPGAAAGGADDLHAHRDRARRPAAGPGPREPGALWLGAAARRRSSSSAWRSWWRCCWSASASPPCAPGPRRPWSAPWRACSAARRMARVATRRRGSRPRRSPTPSRRRGPRPGRSRWRAPVRCWPRRSGRCWPSGCSRGSWRRRPGGARRAGSRR